MNIDLIPGVSEHVAMRGRGHPVWISRGRRNECDTIVVYISMASNVTIKAQIASVGAPELFHNVFCCFASLIQAGQANWQGKVLHCDCFEVVFCIKHLLVFKSKVSALWFSDRSGAMQSEQCNAMHGADKVCKISVTISRLIQADDIKIQARQHGQAARNRPTFAELPSPQKILPKVEATPVPMSLGQSTQNPSSRQLR